MSEVEKIISSARDKYTVHECGECTYRKCCELGFGSADCMSRRVSISLMLGIEDSFFSKLLDEIESAVKQEKAEWEAAACACVSDAVMSGRVAVEHKPVGNAAAMYDALVKIAHYCDDKDGMDDPYCADGHILSDIARAALSEPARNCDHGDYLERFKCFCRGRNCQGCKYEGDGADCFAAFLLDRAEEGGKQ